MFYLIKVFYVFKAIAICDINKNKSSIYSNVLLSVTILFYDLRLVLQLVYSYCYVNFYAWEKTFSEVHYCYIFILYTLFMLYKPIEICDISKGAIFTMFKFSIIICNFIPSFISAIYSIFYFYISIFT